MRARMYEDDYMCTDEELSQAFAEGLTRQQAIDKSVAATADQYGVDATVVNYAGGNGYPVVKFRGNQQAVTRLMRESYHLADDEINEMITLDA